MQINSDYTYYPDGDCPQPTVYESDNIQLTQLLGPDGKPYAIRRPQQRIGFVLRSNK